MIPNKEERHKLDEEARQLRSELESMKKEISDLRKGGHYTRFAEQLATSVWPKIRMYNATGDKGDHEKIRAIFQDIKDEIEKTKRNDNDVYWKKEQDNSL